MTESQDHDRLSPGVARLADGSNDGEGRGENTNTSVRIVPIPEGETTRGLSGTPTHWDRDVLERAVQNGVFDGAKLLKSPGGPGHKEMDEQANPDNIIGGVQNARYEPGTGPVLEADLLDEHMADLVENQLVGVSPDLYRKLGDYDAELDAYAAEEIVDVPYITVLDVPASDGASIEPVNAEALAHSDAGQFLKQEAGAGHEQLADISVHEPSYSGTAPDRDWFRPTQSDFDTDDLSDIDDHFLASEDGFPPENFGDLHLPVVFPNGDLSRSGLRTAKSRASQIEGISESTVSRVRSMIDDLASSAFDADWGEEEQNADERAEPRAGSETTTQNSQSMAEEDDSPTKNELREQLAAAKAQRDQAQDKAETLESEVDSLESEVEETEEELEATQSDLEAKEERIEDLSDQAENYRETLAGMVAEGSPLQTEDILDSGMDTTTLETRVVESKDLAEEDDDRDPREIVSEQMAQAPALRGGASGEESTTADEGSGSSSSGGFSEERLAQAEQNAEEALSMHDKATAPEDSSLREIAKQKTGVDPAEAGSKQEYARLVEQNAGQNEQNANANGDD